MKKLFYRLTGILDFFGTFSFIAFVGEHQDIIYGLVGGKVLAVFSFIAWTVLLIINLTGIYSGNVETFDVIEEIRKCNGDIIALFKTVTKMAGVYTNPMLIPIKDRKTVNSVLIVYYLFKLFVCFEFWREAVIPVLSFG